MLDIQKKITVSDRERACLEVLADGYCEGEPYSYNFSYLVTRTGFDRIMVRRSVRALARKGLAEFAKGLWSEDGEMRGSGYGCTKAGADWLRDYNAAKAAKEAKRKPTQSLVEGNSHA